MVRPRHRDCVFGAHIDVCGVQDEESDQSGLPLVGNLVFYPPKDH